MGDKSKISWTDATWNPTVGCTRVSDGCDHCYAFALHDQRYAANLKAGAAFGPTQGHRGGRPNVAMRARELSEMTCGLPFPRQYDQPFSKLQLLPDRLDQPLRWRKPRRIFVNSMSDLFHEDVPWKFISEVWGIMQIATHHVFQILTKRPGRMREWSKAVAYNYSNPHDTYPLPNVWLGVSVEDQATADERIPLLLETPAAVRFVSYEPALGPVDFGLLRDTQRCDCGEVRMNCDCPRIDWVIVGGESGPHHRPMDHAWVARVREQCRAAGVAFWGKQDAGKQPGIALPGELGDKAFPQPLAALCEVG